MRYLCFCLFFVVVTPLWAAMCGITWPEGEVSTSEISSSLQYPIANMLDGNPATAWVYHKAWRDLPPGVIGGYSDNPDAAFKHGVGAFIYVQTNWETPVICDSIGIINGYAKNNDIYQRNNRITQITLIYSGPKGNFEKAYTLRETLEMQRIPLPHFRLRRFFIRITAVKIGKDDDLCISELVLFHGNTPVPWRVTPIVLSTPTLECDGRPTYTLVHGQKEVALSGHKALSYYGFPQLHTSRVLLLGSQELILYDLRRCLVVWRHTFTGTATQIGWQNTTQALFQTEDRHKRPHWYRFDARHLTWQRCPAPSKKKKNHFLEDVTTHGC